MVRYARLLAIMLVAILIAGPALALPGTTDWVSFGPSVLTDPKPKEYVSAGSTVTLPLTETSTNSKLLQVSGAADVCYDANVVGADSVQLGSATFFQAMFVTGGGGSPISPIDTGRLEFGTLVSGDCFLIQAGYYWVEVSGITSATLAIVNVTGRSN